METNNVTEKEILRYLKDIKKFWYAEGPMPKRCLRS